MPGVFRPYSLADVLGTINDQSLDNGDDTSVAGLGYFAETDENALISDSATATAGVNPGWDLGTWGVLTWS